MACLLSLTLLLMSPTLSLQTGSWIVNFFRPTRVILLLTLRERGIHIRLVLVLACSCLFSPTLLRYLRVPGLLISFARHGSYCRSRLENEVYILGLFLFWFVLVVVAHAFAVPAGSWIVNISFARHGSYCRSRLEN